MTTRQQAKAIADGMVPTSPLSSLSSSDDTFYTAANDSMDSKSTAASSPVDAPLWTFRDARQLPHELKGHCQIFLEEQLCAYHHTALVRPSARAHSGRD